MKFSAHAKLVRPWLLIALLPIYRLIKRYKPVWVGVPNEIEADIYGSSAPPEGNFLYRLIFPRFFQKIRYEIASEEKLRWASDSASIVYVMRSAGQLEYNYFRHLFFEKSLPVPVFANEISLRRFMPWKLFRATFITQLEALEKYGGLGDVVRSGAFSGFISKRKGLLLSLSPSELEDETILLSPSQKLLLAVISAHKKIGQPIYLVPLEFVWDRRPSKEKNSVIDILFGEKENPGVIRKIVLFWRNYRHRAVAKIGEPIELAELLKGINAASDETSARHFGGSLLAALRLERRTITGPLVHSRSWFIERVLLDERFGKTLCELATGMDKKGDDLYDLSRKYLSEIVSDINYTYIELGNIILKWVFKSLYDGLTFNEDGLNKVKRISATTPVVFVSNHKSHFDYLLLSYILHSNYMTVPHVTAGINLSFWPLGPIFRHCGAFFIRRSFDNNKLYRACIETYLRILLCEGYSQEFYIEGGRSRTGKLLPPKHGMLKMLTDAVETSAVDDICFVPVSFTYDRVIEQKVYENEISGGNKEDEKPTHLIKLLKYLRRQKPKYGKIYVNFGEPVFYRQITKGTQREKTEALADNICHEINRNIVATPQALLAAALLSFTEKGITRKSLFERYSLLLDYAKSKGVQLAKTVLLNEELVFSAVLDGFVTSKTVMQHGEDQEIFFTIDEAKRPHLDYYKNGCVHFFASLGVFSKLLLRRLDDNVAMSIDEFLDDFSFCKLLLKYEFRFSDARPVTEHIKKIKKFLISKGVITMEGENSFKISFEAGSVLIPFSNLMSNFFESIKVALVCIKSADLKKVEEKDLVKKMMQTGKNMLLLGHIHYREAISKANFTNTLYLFRDLGILHGKKNLSSKGDRKLISDLQVQLERLV